MKKLIVSIACGLAFTGAAFAQGYIVWGIPTGDVTINTNTILYSPLFGGGATGGGATGLITTTANSFYFALLTSPSPTGSLTTSTNPIDGSWTGASANGGGAMMGTNTTGLTHGGVSVGAVNGQSGNVQVSWANGTTNNTLLVGWSANLGLLGSGAETWLNVSNVLAQWQTGANYSSQAVAGQNYFFGTTVAGDVNPALSSPGNGVFGANSNPTATGIPIFSPNSPLFLLPVPEPSTMVLAGLGGLSLLLFRRRK